MNYIPIRTLSVNPQTNRFILDKGGPIPEGPAIYGIENVKTNQIYIGQAVDALRRVRNEISYCRNQSGKPEEVPELRKAWLNPNEGESAFRICPGKRAFDHDSENELKRRKAIQQSRIGKVPEMVLSGKNQPTGPRDPRSTEPKPVSIQGTVYSSVNEAAQALGFNRMTVVRRCNSTKPEFTNWYFLFVDQS